MPESALPAPAAFSEADTLELRSVVRGVAANVLRTHANHPDVEDCTSETLRRAVEYRHRLRKGEPIRPWLIGIARHVALDLIRSRRRGIQGMTAPSTETADGIDPVERVPDSKPGPDELLEKERQRHELQRVLDALPEGVSQALLLFHVEGKSYQEIAGELKVPLGTVATWVTRGRKALAEKLAREGFTP